MDLFLYDMIYLTFKNRASYI